MEKSREVQLRIGEDGSITAVFDDDLVDALKPEKVEVHRASRVEWEAAGNFIGWTVRADSDPERAIRIGLINGAYRQVVSTDSGLPLAVFIRREFALEAEREHFWELIQEDKNG